MEDFMHKQLLPALCFLHVVTFPPFAKARQQAISEPNVLWEIDPLYTIIKEGRMFKIKKDRGVALTRIDLATGLDMWTAQIEDFDHFAYNCYHEKSILVVSLTKVYMIEISTGKILWNRPTEKPNTYQDCFGDTVAHSIDYSRVEIIDRHSGITRWSIEGDDQVAGVDSDILYAYTDLGLEHIKAYSLSSGDFRWERSGKILVLTGQAFSTEVGSKYKQTTYTKLSSVTGEELWTFHGKGWTTFESAANGRRVVSDRENVYLLEESSDKIVWNTAISSADEALDLGFQIKVEHSDGSVTILDPRDGAILKSYKYKDKFLFSSKDTLYALGGDKFEVTNVANAQSWLYDARLITSFADSSLMQDNMLHFIEGTTGSVGAAFHKNGFYAVEKGATGQDIIVAYEASSGIKRWQKDISGFTVDAVDDRAVYLSRPGKTLALAW